MACLLKIQYGKLFVPCSEVKISTIEISQNMILIESDGLIIIFKGPVIPANAGIGNAAADIRVHIIWIYLEGFIERLY